MTPRLYNNHMALKNMPHATENTKNQETLSALRKIWDLTSDHCSQPENPRQNSGTHLSNIFQDIGGEKITNTMDEPTWKIHGELSRQKTAAQAAPSETKQYNQQENHQHMILKDYNPQIIQITCDTQSRTQQLKGQLLAN